MGSFNKFIGMGNLARDPELRYLDSGTAVANFAVAMNRKWRDDRDEEKEEVCFLECVAWQGRAETIADYFRQGDPIHVTGYLKQESWEDKDSGDKRYKIVLVIEGFTFCGDVSGGKGKGKSKGKDRDRDRDRDDDDKRSSRKSGKRPESRKNKDDDDPREGRRERQKIEDDDVPF